MYRSLPSNGAEPDGWLLPGICPPYRVISRIEHVPDGTELYTELKLRKNASILIDMRAGEGLAVTYVDVMQPEQVALVQQIYRLFTKRPEFAHSADNERDFAAILIRAFQKGMTDREQLTTFAGEIAKIRFSEDKPPSFRAPTPY